MHTLPSSRLLALFMLGLLLLPTGCRRSDDRDQPLRLARPFHMTMMGQRFLLRTRLSSIRLRKQLEDSLRTSKHIEFDGAKQKSLKSYQLEINVGMRRARLRGAKSWRNAKKLQALISVTGQLTPVSKKRESIVLEEQTRLTFRRLRPPSINQMQQAILYAWRKLGHSIKILAQLRRQSDNAAFKALKSDDPIAQRHAAYLLGRRKVGAAAPLLIKRLSSDDERVVTAAVGALVRLKDKRAALPMIKVSTNRNPAFLMQVISALSVIGGVDAQSYLFTLANAHDDKRVRQSAYEGFQELIKRAKASARSAKGPTPRRASSG